MLGQIGFKLPKESLDDLRPGKGFTKPLDGFGIKDTLVEIEPQKSHER